MKLVHISDIHINAGPILGLDPLANFEACLAHVEEFQADADRVVITGDLTHHGHEESYERLKARLAASPLKGARAPRLLIGNHDDRETFLRVFPEAQRDANGYVQWTEETPAGLFVYMDTMKPGTHAGHYEAERRDWLDGVLRQAEAARQPAWLFMHHNPIAVQVANADMIGIVQEAELRALLARHRGTVRHIFFGHCHYTLSGAVDGIPFSAPRSTNHTCWPDFSGIASRMGYGELAPNYNVCFLGENGVVIHSIDFLDQHKVRWAETDETGSTTVKFGAVA
jgi:3',5'-cyclic-AMP phosphodiesterase